MSETLESHRNLTGICALKNSGFLFFPNLAFGDVEEVSGRFLRYSSWHLLHRIKGILQLLSLECIYALFMCEYFCTGAVTVMHY